MSGKGVERKYSSSVRLISTTDLQGNITYANPEFCQVAGYSVDELIGRPHSIVRHKDMPAAAFGDLWAYAKDSKPWMGMVKNRCKNGDFYWVQAYVTPLYDSNGSKIGYQSVRTRPTDAQIERAEKVYQKINSRSKAPSLKPQSVSARITVVALIFSFLTILSGLLPLPDPIPLVVQSVLLLTMIGGIWALAKSVKNISKSADQIYPNKLAQYVMTPYMHEVGAAELSTMMMQARLRTVIGRVEDSVDTLTEFVGQTHESLALTSAGIEQQNLETDMLASAATEMSATAHEIAENTSQTSVATREAATLADEGKSIVAEMISGIRDLVGEVKSASEYSGELKHKAIAVKQVVNIINDIAEQTNLLALNAAIEAARAGDQGRGFSVVADEVRVLARRTRESTNEIRETIDAIQLQVDTTVDAMQRCGSNAQENIERAERVGSSFDSVNGAMLDITDRSTQVAAASEEQSAVSEEVSRNIANIREISAENNSIAQRTSASSQELSVLVNDLKSMMKAI
ncbi:MAG: methyl-accepting chemotaxis protein [Neptuniibacter sp.]